MSLGSSPVSTGSPWGVPVATGWISEGARAAGDYRRPQRPEAGRPDLASGAEGETPSPLGLRGAARSSAAPVWPDPSQAIRSPWGQEAGVGSRKSGGSFSVGRGPRAVGSLKAINPHCAGLTQATERSHERSHVAPEGRD